MLGEPIPSLATKGTATGRFLSLANVLLAGTLCVGLFTDWGWTSQVAGVLHVALTLLAGIVGLRWWRRHGRASGTLLAFAATPSLLAGGVAVAGPILMCVPPFTLAAMFAVPELASERIVQREASPGGKWFAVVKYRDVGAYAPGAGRVVIALRPAALSFLERRLAGPMDTDWTANARFVEWVNADKLRFKEAEVDLEIGIIRARWPMAIALARRAFGYVAPRVTSQMTLASAGETEPIPEQCARYEVWDVRIGMTIDDVRHLDPSVKYRTRHRAQDVHLWDVVLWDARSRDGEMVPELVQWRFGYAGTLVTDGSWASSRLIGLRLSAGAIPLGADGEPVRDVPVVRAVHERLGQPERSFDLAIDMRVAELWSPNVQHAEVWIDEECGRAVRLMWGDGPYSSYEDSTAKPNYRYYSIEIYDLEADGVSVEGFLPTGSE